MDTGTSIRVTYWAEPRAGHASIYDLEGIEDFRRALAERDVSVVQGRPGDLIKFGTKAFVLQPFLAAYRILRHRNKDHRNDIEQCRIVFQDSTVVLYKICDDSIFVGLEQIL